MTTEQPAILAKEAKTFQQALKETLKTQEPWDRDVEFQRKNLRQKYLRLLLIHPYARESKDIETHLWMQTSYAFISIYKQRLAALDRTLQASSRQQARQSGHGPVEYRKLLQRFRQFLAEEEKFWTLLIRRFYKAFRLDEAQSALAELKIADDAEDVAAGHLPDPVEPRDAASPPSGRNQHQFPADDGLNVAPRTPEQREGRLAILSKALVCLGDIARYRELYNEGRGRPKAGYDDGSPATRRSGGRNKRGGAPTTDAIARARDYAKAERCYKKAQMLVPHEGNPSHQLAILANYQKDMFLSLYHYYMALCVRQPYDTASENLGTVLNKTLEQWRAHTTREKEKEADKEIMKMEIPAIRAEKFKENVVVLHALWRLGPEKMESLSPNHTDLVLDNFRDLVSGRHLRPDTISQTIIMSQGALWKHRMIRDPPGTLSRRPRSISPELHALEAAVESMIATHVLKMHQVLLEIGIEQVKAPAEVVPGNDLAAHISATFRRTLPTLRIASKWLRANIKYIMQGQISGTPAESERRRMYDSESVLSIEVVRRFLEVYVQFCNALADAFPLEKLPTLKGLLPEDNELRAFLPLRQLMGPAMVEAAGKGGLNGNAVVGHPNEEELMRIADLLEDGKALAAVQDSPVIFANGAFSVNLPEPVTQQRPVLVSQRRDTITNAKIIRERQQIESEVKAVLDTARNKELDDDARTETSRTTDDLLREPFLKVFDPSEEEDEEDEIVWNPRPSLSPIGTKPCSTLPSPPMQSPNSPPIINLSPPATLSSSVLAAQSMPQVPMPTISSSATAEDLLQEVMTGQPQMNGKFPSTKESLTPQSPMLFGSGPARSIWSMSLDNKGASMVAANASHHERSRSLNQTQQGHPHMSPHASLQGPALAQQHWSYTNASLNSPSRVSSSLSPGPQHLSQSQPLGIHLGSVGLGNPRLERSGLDNLDYAQLTGHNQPYVHNQYNSLSPTRRDLPLNVTYGDSLYTSSPAMDYRNHQSHLYQDPTIYQAQSPSPVSHSWHRNG